MNQLPHASICLGVAVVVSGCVLRPRSAGAPPSPALVAQGRKLFLGSCAPCHGADAAGDEGPDLHDLEVSDRYIAHMIAFGKPHEMPSFAKKHGPADIAALVAYVQSL